MFFRARILCTSVAVIFFSLVLQAQGLMAEEVLRNQDVQKMISAGLSEDIIVAKIREASQVDFQLSVDDLVSLRKAGVSDRITSTMLERGKSTAKKPANSFGTIPGSSSAGVSLKTTEGTLPLRLVTGRVSSAGWNVFMNYPGLSASVRTHDKRPSLLVTCSSGLEAGQYYFANLEPDKRRETRSLKLGQAIRRSGIPGGRLAPDADWVRPFDVQEEGSGTWRITLKIDLKPGEYGWYVNLPDTDDPYYVLKHPCFIGGGIFDFGVD
jgi:hypothetical protein